MDINDYVSLDKKKERTGVSISYGINHYLMDSINLIGNRNGFSNAIDELGYIFDGFYKDFIPVILSKFTNEQLELLDRFISEYDFKSYVDLNKELDSNDIVRDIKKYFIERFIEIFKMNSITFEEIYFNKGFNFRLDVINTIGELKVSELYLLIMHFKYIRENDDEWD